MDTPVTLRARIARRLACHPFTQISVEGPRALESLTQARRPCVITAGQLGFDLRNPGELPVDHVGSPLRIPRRPAADHHVNRRGYLRKSGR